MPRSARIKSSTDIYHVMFRGIDRQKIFNEKSDYYRYLSILKKCKELSGFKLYAYCLMPNHVHLLIKVGEEPIDVLTKRLGTSYVHWFNDKYDRVGHLFQDRFKSENVEDEEYFFTVLRYIIQNPFKAGLERKIGTYSWTSYHEYSSGEGFITDIWPVIKMMGDRTKVVNFLIYVNDDTAMEMDDFNKRLSKGEAARVFFKVSGLRSISDYQRLPKEAQNETIRIMYKQGMSVPQISEHTGIPKSTVQRKVKGLR